MATRHRSNRFSTELPTDIDVIVKELAALDHLDILGVDADITRRDLTRFHHGSLADFDRVATRGEQAIGLLHERLKISIDDQVLEKVLESGEQYPRAEINGLVAHTLEHIAKQHYAVTSATDKEHISLSDINNPKSPFSDALTTPEKAYIVRSVGHLSQGVQQAIGQSLGRAKRLQSLPFNATLMLIDNANRSFATDAKFVGLSYEHIVSNHFSDSTTLSDDMSPVTDTQMVMEYVQNSRHLNKLSIEHDAIKEKIEQAQDNLPVGVSGRIKLAVIHQALEEVITKQVHDNASGHIVSVDMMKDVHNGLREVAQLHYNHSPTADDFIPTYSMYSTLTHAPLPDSISAQQYEAIASSTAHLSHGARQYVAANLADHKGDADFDYSKSVDVIKRSLQAFDGAVTHVRVLSPTHAFARFDNDLSSTQAQKPELSPPTPEPEVEADLFFEEVADIEPSATIKSLIAVIEKEGLNKASGLDTAVIRSHLAAFEADIPPNTDKELGMALIHHELEELALSNTKARFAGKTTIHDSENPAYEAAIQATKHESFFTARSHYDVTMGDKTNNTQGFIRFVDRDDRGRLKKAPFPHTLSTDQHAVLLKTLRDFSQGQKQLIGSQVRDFTNTTKGVNPKLTNQTIKAALGRFDDAYRLTRPHAYIDSQADFDIRHTLAESSAKKPVSVPATSQNRSKNANSVTKHDFGDNYANLMLDGLSKEGSQLKKSYNDPKSTTDMLYNGTKNFLKTIDTLTEHALHLSNTAKGEVDRLDMIKNAVSRLGDIKDKVARDAGRKGFMNKAGNISLSADFERTETGINHVLESTALNNTPKPELILSNKNQPTAS